MAGSSGVVGGAGCPHQWTAATHAQFGVTRAAAKSRDLAVYQGLARYFVEPRDAEDRRGRCSVSSTSRWELALELLWAQLFRCSLFRCRAGAPLTPECDGAAMQSPNAAHDGFQPVSLTFDENLPLGCTRLHAARRNVHEGAGAEARE
eukprot:1891748-Prymnesium_polylepis.2